MPRGRRLDAPGTLHAVRVREIDRRRLFETTANRQDFEARRDAVGGEGAPGARLDAPTHSRAPAGAHGRPAPGHGHAPAPHRVRGHVQSPASARRASLPESDKSSLVEEEPYRRCQSDVTRPLDGALRSHLDHCSDGGSNLPRDERSDRRRRRARSAVRSDGGAQSLSSSPRSSRRS